MQNRQFLSFFCHSVRKRDLDTKKNSLKEKLQNIQIYPESPQSNYQTWLLFHQLFKSDLNLKQKKMLTYERSSTPTRGLVYDTNTDIVTVT